MVFTERAYPIFEQVIKDYHVHDNIDQPMVNPFEEGTIHKIMGGLNKILKEFSPEKY